MAATEWSEVVAKWRAIDAVALLAMLSSDASQVRAILCRGANDRIPRPTWPPLPEGVDRLQECLRS